jgi:hypothetical protein
MRQRGMNPKDDGRMETPVKRNREVAAEAGVVSEDAIMAMAGGGHKREG